MRDAHRIRGSSPLTRGKHTCHYRLTLTQGLIPAHAGKTACRVVPDPANGAHPRSRGENRTGAAWSREGLGSSPLTRGKPLIAAGVPLPVGLIPAHAGKTKLSAKRFLTKRAHPRSRGENVTGASGLVWVRGSSPLTRGKLEGFLAVFGGERLIPAHAGKTRRR